MKFLKSSINVLISILLLISLQACGGESPERTETGANSDAPGLTEFQLEHGIGPVTEHIEINDDLDPELIEQGRNIYEMKCEMCHNMEGRMVGPPLGEITDKRSPEFLMNMILNPGEMARAHPVGQELLREYMTVMPFQNVQRDEARAIVEFLRYYNENN